MKEEFEAYDPILDEDVEDEKEAEADTDDEDEDEEGGEETL